MKRSDFAANREWMDQRLLSPGVPHRLGACKPRHLLSTACRHNLGEKGRVRGNPTANRFRKQSDTSDETTQRRGSRLFQRSKRGTLGKNVSRKIPCNAYTFCTGCKKVSHTSCASDKSGQAGQERVLRHFANNHVEFLIINP